MLPFVVRILIGSMVISGQSSENRLIEFKWWTAGLVLLLWWSVFLWSSIIMFIEFAFAGYIGWVSFIVFVCWYLLCFLFWRHSRNMLVLFVISRCLETDEWRSIVKIRKKITFIGLFCTMAVDRSSSSIWLTSWSSSMSSYSESFPSITSATWTRSIDLNQIRKQKIENEPYHQWAISSDDNHWHPRPRAGWNLTWAMRDRNDRINPDIWHWAEARPRYQIEHRPIRQQLVGFSTIARGSRLLKK